MIEVYKNWEPNFFIRISIFVWHIVSPNVYRILDEFIGIPREIVKMEKSLLIVTVLNRDIFSPTRVREKDETVFELRRLLIEQYKWQNVD